MSGVPPHGAAAPRRRSGIRLMAGAGGWIPNPDRMVIATTDDLGPVGVGVGRGAALGFCGGARGRG